MYQICRKLHPSLHPYLGKVWKRSLGTRDEAEAQRRIVPLLAQSNEEIALAKAMLAGHVQLSPTDAQQLAARWFREELADLERTSDYARFLHADFDPSIDEKTGECIGLVYSSLDDYLDGDTVSFMERVNVVTPFINHMLRAHKIAPIPINSSLHLQLVDAFLVHLQDLTTLCAARIHSNGRYVPPPVLAPHVPLSFEACSALEEEHKKKLSEVFKKWAEDKRQTDGDNRSTGKTIGEFGATVNRFIELHGDLPVGHITLPVCQEFRIALGKIPTSGKGIRGLTASALIEKAAAEGLPTASLSTVVKQLGALSAVLGFAKKTLRAIPEEPISASGMLQRLKKAAKRHQDHHDDDKGYSRTDLRTIFASPLFRGAWQPAVSDFGRALYWLPLLMVYCGARLGELARLEVAQVVRDADSGVWFLSILPDEAETVKKASSRRKVPLHRDLVALGFLDYVQGLPAEGRLFPNLNAHPANGYGYAVGKAWAKYLKDVVRLESEAAPSHGFRHAFKTLARSASITEELSDYITGHAPANVGRQYGTRLLELLSSEIQKYPSIAREAGLLTQVME